MPGNISPDETKCVVKAVDGVKYHMANVEHDYISLCGVKVWDSDLAWNSWGLQPEFFCQKCVQIASEPF